LPFSLVSSLLLWPKTPTADVLTVPERLVVPTVLVEAVVPAQLAKNATVDHASVIVVALDLSADLTDVEPLVETVFQDKLASTENVLELVLLNVSDLTEQ
jgi:hypothetical protein